MVLRLRIEGTGFRDNQNREIILHGVNLGGDAKLPARPDQPSHVNDGFFDGDNVSFVGRPFGLDEAHIHFGRLRRWGYNTLRYVYTWEAIEAAGPGKYDEEWIQYTISVLRIAKEYGFYVFMDPHQDVWSRFTGGSGAPMWTLYACGLDPERFGATEAALVQNTWPEPKAFPKMIWATNYTRLACQVMVTLFFGGRDFAPKAIIDGVNIQDYLQDHFIAACSHLALRVREAGDLDQDVVIGWESMNEPNRGLIGSPDISSIPSEQKLQLGTSPTAWQAILTGSGRACEIETWAFGNLGPYKSGSQLVDPGGLVAWLQRSSMDSHYGWKRDPGWKLGQCLWAQHGVWDPSSDTLLKKDYFSRNPRTNESIDYEYFTNTYFMSHYRKFKTAIRAIFPNTILFCQSPVLELPPSLKGTPDDDPNMVYAPHWYDGVTLMNKKWNRLWNVDVFGVLRGRYLTPAFAIKLGETAIKNCFKESLQAITKEGLDYMGTHPCLIGEIGIPYDMDNAAAYKSGDYTSQILAMDANYYALERSSSNFTIWTYCASNDHEWGDQWNGEDLSIVSVDDRMLPSNLPYDGPVSPGNLKSTMGVASMEARTLDSTMNSYSGNSFRAAEAYVRPTPVAVNGKITSYGFDLRKCVFNLTIEASSSSTEAPTEIFLPGYHFPPGQIDVELSGGKFKIESDNHPLGPQRRLKWWHAGGGTQSIQITGPKTREGSFLGIVEGGGFLDECRERGCSVM